MTGRTDSFTLIGRRMRKALPVATIEEAPSIAEVLRRVDLAIAQRRAA